MPIYDTFSHRKRVAEGKPPDVYVYEELPDKLRVQIIHIWRRAIGRYTGTSSNERDWVKIHDMIAEEHGKFSLGSQRSHGERCEAYVLHVESVDDALDVVEICFRYIDRIVRRLGIGHRDDRGITAEPDEAIADLNGRFQRAGVGYRFEQGRIIRIDSDLIHSEIVKPALGYLGEPGFEGPREEFLNAHAHYRAGETKDAVTDANNAFESTLRTVCDRRGWSYEPGAPAPALIRILRDNGLLPNYLDKSFDQLAATLRSGLPQVRHSEGGHGQGSTPRETPDYVAGYALHLAAASILFIVKAHKAMG